MGMWDDQRVLRELLALWDDSDLGVKAAVSACVGQLKEMEGQPRARRDGFATIEPDLHVVRWTERDVTVSIYWSCRGKKLLQPHGLHAAITTLHAQDSAAMALALIRLREFEAV